MKGVLGKNSDRQREGLEELQQLDGFRQQFRADKSLGGIVGQFAQSVEQAARGHLLQTVDTALQVVLQRASHPRLYDRTVNRRATVEEEPAVEDVAVGGFGPIQQGAQLMGEHIAFGHNADVKSQQVAPLVVVVVLTVADLYFQFAFSGSVVEYHERTVELNRLVVNPAVLEQYLPHAAEDLVLTGDVQEIEIQVHRETRQLVEEHQCRAALETQDRSQHGVRIDVLQNL